MQLLILFASALIPLNLASLSANDPPSLDVPYWIEFVDYATEYKKSYLASNKDDDLVQKRFHAFQINVERIKKHNDEYERGVQTFTLGLNEIADLTDEEYKQLLSFKYRKASANRVKAALFEPTDSFQNLPDSWDWRAHDAVTPIKNQGQCGSCWAFSAVAALESVYAIATGKLVSFSEQELVDCTLGGMDNCNHGGEMSDGFEEIIAHHGGKIDPESVYEYTAVSKGICHAQDDKAVGHFTSYVNVTSGDEHALKEAVATKSVISVAIDASSFKFQLYRHGVFNHHNCGKKMEELDHGVAVVGYGVYRKREFWLVKNSWGELWGMKGYIMMSRNKDNQCGIATDPSYPVMTKQTEAVKQIIDQKMADM